jgi:hypothetical protein
MQYEKGGGTKRYGDIRNHSTGSCRKQNHPVIKEYLGKRNGKR